MCIHIAIYLIDVHTKRRVCCVFCFLLTSVTYSVGMQRRFPPQSVEINNSSRKKESSGKKFKMNWHRL